MMRRGAFGILVVVALAAPLFLVALGQPGLNDPDEGRNAEVAREMHAGGDWVTPHINDARYLDKPPVFFWSVALSYALVGVNETGARLPSALSALAAVGLTVWFARRRLGADAGWIAGALLALSPLYFVFARLVIFDMMLLLTTTASVIAIYESMEGEVRGRAAPALVFAAAGIGTITKGPVALVVPLLVAVVWSFLRRRPSLLMRLNWGTGLLIYLAIVAPWLVMVEGRNPGFLRYALLGENLARMARNPYDTQRPFHFYFKVILPGVFPWILLCTAQGVRSLWRRVRGGHALDAASAARTEGGIDAPHEARAIRFAGVWFGVLYLFFSLIASKRPSYILPCSVPIALLAASLIARACRSAAPAGGTQAAVPADREARSDLAWGSWAIALTCLAAALAVAIAGPALRSTALPEARLSQLAANVTLFNLTAACLAAAAIAILFAMRTGRAPIIVAALALPLLAMVPMARAASAQIQNDRSSRGLSRFLESRLKPGDTVICWEEYRPGLNFYLKRPIYQVTRAGRIFTSNYIATHLDEFRSDPSFRLLSQEGLRQALRKDGSTAYVLADEKEYERMFEATGLPMQPVWEKGGFGLFVRADAQASASPAAGF